MILKQQEPEYPMIIIGYEVFDCRALAMRAGWVSGVLGCVKAYRIYRMKLK